MFTTAAYATNSKVVGGVCVADSDRDYRVPYRNAEGYPDPTTHGALSNVMREYAAKEEADARCTQLIKTLKSTIDLAGFDLIARIEVRDRNTGRTYR